MDLKLAVAKLYSNEAEKLQNAGQLKAAIALYHYAVKIKPDDYLNYYSLGLVTIRLGQLEQAKGYLEKSIELAPEQGDSYYQLAKIFQQQGEFERAISAYQEAIKFTDNNDNFYFDLGELLFKRQRLTEAEANLQRAVSINNKLFWGYYYLGLIKRQQGKNQSALNFFCQTIKIEPENSQGYWGFQYTQVDDFLLPELIKFYQQIIAEYPSVSLAWGNLGDLLSQQGKIEAASCCYQTSCYHQITNENPHLIDLNWQPKKIKPPDFIVVGASKCGTSSLFQYLNYHPQILLPHKKEINYFTPEKLEMGLDWYYSHFPAIADYEDLITGEASPAYFNNPYARENISKLSGVKIIILLRNPVTRVISWYYHNIKCGRENRELSAVIESEIATARATSATKIDYSLDYIADSIYVGKVRKWLEIIPQENILIVQTEELARHPAITMEQVFDFLALPNYQSIEYIKHNKGYYESEKHSDLIKTMGNFFMPYNQQLEELLDRQFNWERDQ